MRRIFTPMLAVTAALAIAAPAASAHVSAQPPEQPAGGFTVVTLRVPNERPEATEKVEVQFPDGITSVRTKPVEGWTATVRMEQLDVPIDDGHGGKVTEQVDTVTFSGGEVKEGEFQEFPLSLKMPEEGELGDLLFFPAVQTYVGGEQVAWIEKPASEDDDAELERPSPKVTLVAAAGGHGAAAAGDAKDDATDDSKDDSHDEAGSDDAASDDDDEDEAEGRVNAALGLAIAAFVISALALFRSMRGRTRD